MAVREIILTAQHSTAQHSTAQHSTAQHSDSAFLRHGHTWKLRKRIYSNTIFTKSKEDSDEKIKA